MLATVPHTTNDFSLQNLKLVEGAADTWDTYTLSIREAIFEALTERNIAMQDYTRVLALADTWETQLQEAQQNSCSDSAYEALLRRNICRDKARHLKGLIDQYSAQVSTLESQLAFWQHQLA